MAHTLWFRSKLSYDPAGQGIPLDVVMEANGKRVRLLANIDTGAQNCIFNRGYGESLGLAIETGMPKTFSTATGSFRAFGHEVGLSAMGLDLDATVYFPEDTGFLRSVLGREGWLRSIRMGIVDYDGHVFVSHYNDPRP